MSKKNENLDNDEDESESYIYFDNVGSASDEKVNRKLKETLVKHPASKQTPAKQTSSKPEIRQTPEQTPAKQTSSKPEIRQTPEQTPAKQTSSKPEIRQTPEQTPAKQTSSKPEVRQTPEQNPGKQTSSKPEIRQTPEQTPAKQTSSKPEIRQTSKPTVKQPDAKQSDLKHLKADIKQQSSDLSIGRTFTTSNLNEFKKLLKDDSKTELDKAIKSDKQSTVDKPTRSDERIDRPIDKATDKVKSTENERSKTDVRQRSAEKIKSTDKLKSKIDKKKSNKDLIIIIDSQNSKKAKEGKKSKEDKKPKEDKRSKEDRASKEDKRSKEDADKKPKEDRRSKDDVKASNEDKKSKEDKESKEDADKRSKDDKASKEDTDKRSKDDSDKKPKEDADKKSKDDKASKEDTDKRSKDDADKKPTEDKRSKDDADKKSKEDKASKEDKRSKDDADKKPKEDRRSKDDVKASQEAIKSPLTAQKPIPPIIPQNLINLKKSSDDLKKLNECESENPPPEDISNLVSQSLANTASSVLSDTKPDTKPSLPGKKESDKNVFRPGESQKEITKDGHKEGKQSTNLLEKIKNKLEEQIYLKQDKPSDYKSTLAQNKKSSVQAKYEADKLKSITHVDQLSKPTAPKKSDQKKVERSKPMEKKSSITTRLDTVPRKTKSLNDLRDVQQENELRKIKSDPNQTSRRSPPKLEVASDKHKKEINIKTSQNMKANLSLGKVIKAQVDDGERTLNKELKSEENDQESDWSSISIQLDIVKDPKTKIIEINEDVKVLPEIESGDDEERMKSLEQEQQIKRMKSKKYLETSKKDQEDELAKELKEYKDDSPERRDTFSNLLMTKPSITHYVKQDKEPSIEKKDDKFNRYYESNEERTQGKIDEPKSTQSVQMIPSFSLKEKKEKPIDTDADQAVVLFKAETTDSDKQSSKDSEKSFKRLGILNLNLPEDKKSFLSSPGKKTDEWSSDEQTYEQVIKQKNELFKLQFPTMNFSPPPSQPIPPPFHLKMTKSKDTIGKDMARSEELTYHEQKEKFALKTRIKNGKKFESKEDENKCLKAKTEPGEESTKNGKLIKPNETVEMKKNYEIKIDRKDFKLNRSENRSIRSIDSSKQLISNDQINGKKTAEEDRLLVGKFNNEIDRLRRLERYLKKVKVVLNNEKTEMDIKKSIFKRLILIKKDLNKLTNLCDQLMNKKCPDKTYLEKRKKSLIPDESSGSSYSEENEEDRLRRRTKLISKRDGTNKSQLERPMKGNKLVEEEPKDETTESKREHKLDDHRNDKQRSKDKVKIEKPKDERTSLCRSVFRSSIFRFFLIFIIICTFIFSYCYYKRSRMPYHHKRFQCKLKRKM